jgi:hypothetical protein
MTGQPLRKNHAWDFAGNPWACGNQPLTNVHVGYISEIVLRLKLQFGAARWMMKRPRHAAAGAHHGSF